jgi:hypothetical protein
MTLTSPRLLTCVFFAAIVGAPVATLQSGLLVSAVGTWHQRSLSHRQQVGPVAVEWLQLGVVLSSVQLLCMCLLLLLQIVGRLLLFVLQYAWRRMLACRDDLQPPFGLLLLLLPLLSGLLLPLLQLRCAVLLLASILLLNSLCKFLSRLQHLVVPRFLLLLLPLPLLLGHHCLEVAHFCCLAGIMCSAILLLAGCTAPQPMSVSASARASEEASGWIICAPQDGTVQLCRAMALANWCGRVCNVAANAF